jgi:hypothetical protein
MSIRRFLAAGAVSVAIGLPILAQAPASTDKPSFEVASVKPNKSGDGRVAIGNQPGGRFTATNVPLARRIGRTASTSWPRRAQIFLPSRRAPLPVRCSSCCSRSSPSASSWLLIRRHGSSRSTRSRSHGPMENSGPGCARRPSTARRLWPQHEPEAMVRHLFPGQANDRRAVSESRPARCLAAVFPSRNSPTRCLRFCSAS